MTEPTDNNCICACGKTCLECGCVIVKELSILDRSFWDLWVQKIFRNLASMKFQWLLLLYIPTIWGMFHTIPGITPPKPWISETVGLGFLGGGFVTLALGRIYAKTKLKEIEDNRELDTDK